MLNVMPALNNLNWNIHEDLWFQHDGAPAHNARIVKNYLNENFLRRWIGRGGEIS